MQRRFGSYFYKSNSTPEETPKKSWSVSRFIRGAIRKTCIAIGAVVLFRHGVLYALFVPCWFSAPLSSWLHRGTLPSGKPQGPSGFASSTASIIWVAFLGSGRSPGSVCPRLRAMVGFRFSKPWRCSEACFLGRFFCLWPCGGLFAVLWTSGSKEVLAIFFSFFGSWSGWLLSAFPPRNFLITRFPPIHRPAS